MEYFSWKFVCFVIIFIRSDFINGIYFKTCNEYKDKMSSSKFIKSEVNHSVYTCGLRCSIINLCDGYTFNTDNRTCSLYRIRELEFINETTTDTQLYLTQSGKIITHVIQQILSYIWLNLVRLLLMLYNKILNYIWLNLVKLLLMFYMS